MYVAFSTYQIRYHEHGGYGLGYHRRPRDAVDAHSESDDEEKIQYHVEYSRDREKDKRSVRVAGGAEYGSSEIVYQTRRNANEIYLHVKR